MLLTFNATTRTHEVLVDLLNDNEFEGDEDFNGILTLTSGERVVVDPENALATIVDNDGNIGRLVAIVLRSDVQENILLNFNC